MEWNVYYHDFNREKIIQWNVFKHHSFNEEVDNLLNFDLTKQDLSNQLNQIALYYFWAKCEYEVIISPWTGRAKDIKIDIYSQLHMNWDAFVDYVWEHRYPSKWVLYSDKVPKICNENTVYLVKTKAGNVYEMNYGYAYEDDEEPSFHKWDRDGYFCFKTSVVAWMIKPEKENKTV